MANIIGMVTSKAVRLNKYRKILTSQGEFIETAITNSIKDSSTVSSKALRQAKYNAQSLENTPVTDTFVSTLTDTSKYESKCIFTPVHPSVNIPRITLNNQEMTFFSENLSGVSKAEIEQGVAEIFEITNINGLTGFSKRIKGKEFSKSAYSTRAMLEAKYKDPEHYNDILTLAKLNREGKIKYFPSFVMPNGKTNPIVKQDIQAILEGRNYFEQFATENSFEILSKTKVGDAFSIGDRMYVRDKVSYIPLKIDKRTYELLFPPVDRYAMAQGPTQNCGPIAVINNLVQVPTNRVKMYQMFEQQGNKITVRAIGNPNDSMTFDLNNLKSLDDGILSDTCYGLKMLERKGAMNLNGTKGYSPATYTPSRPLDYYFVPAINHTPHVLSKVKPFERPFMSAKERQIIIDELKTIGNGKTMVSGGGGNYSLGTGNSHFISVYDYKNGKVIFANPNATGDYQEVLVEDFVSKYLGTNVFHNPL